MPLVVYFPGELSGLYEPRPNYVVLLDDRIFGAEPQSQALAEHIDRVGPCPCLFRRVSSGLLCLPRRAQPNRTDAQDRGRLIQQTPEIFPPLRGSIADELLAGRSARCPSGSARPNDAGNENPGDGSDEDGVCHQRRSHEQSALPRHQAVVRYRTATYRCGVLSALRQPTQSSHRPQPVDSTDHVRPQISPMPPQLDRGQDAAPRVILDRRATHREELRDLFGGEDLAEEVGWLGGAIVRCGRWSSRRASRGHGRCAPVPHHSSSCRSALSSR